MPVDIADFTTALRQYAAGVCLMTVRDDIDDVGTTVSSVSLTDGGYPAEVLEEVGRCALTVLGAQHAIVASRFASHGRPSARHLLQSVPWERGSGSGAIVLTDAPAALDCRLERLVPAGDHVLALLALEDVAVLNPSVAPLIRLRGRYVDETGSAAGR
jgi:flavin reductase (DIM6/NTAB) family NADH-FMN oxidoreductase RutF